MGLHLHLQLRFGFGLLRLTLWMKMMKQYFLEQPATRREQAGLNGALQWHFNYSRSLGWEPKAMGYGKNLKSKR